MIVITERASPKVNLTLRVLGQRLDGYHELESLVVFARDVSDTVTLRASTSQPRVTCEGPFAGGIASENLISVALRRIHEAAPDLTLGDVMLTKLLPVAAGIGGGSADVAALIRAVQTLKSASAEAIDWIGLAQRLGADVPVCLASKAQVMRGIGERLEEVPDFPELAAVLVNSYVPVPGNPCVPVPENKTAQVFRALGARPLGLHAAARETPADFADADAVLLHMTAIDNDLTEPARRIMPAIGGVLDALKSTPGCRRAQLSGGGPTCFGIYDDMTAADEAARAISAAHPAWWVVPTRLQ